MSQRIIKIGCGYNENVTTFSLRAISLAEERKFNARFAEISKTGDETEKERLEYEALVDAVASWSAEPLKIKIDGKEALLFSNEVNAADSIREFFKERDADKERLINKLVLNFQSKLQPDVVFY